MGWRRTTWDWGRISREEGKPQGFTTGDIGLGWGHHNTISLIRSYKKIVIDKEECSTVIVPCVKGM
jgi:hypothetical protein